MISNRPARLSVSPFCNNHGDEPKIITDKSILLRVSSSHKDFTKEDQLGSF